ncbi:MAG: hypothetical protein K0R01_196 [Mycobacterium sp.]|nr:hypothetical protein [Mycobacterium sp.]
MTGRADNRLDDAPMTPVRCRRCTAEVLVRKSSWSQTSVQWNRTAVALCWERADATRVSAAGARNLFLACSGLQESIVEAVRHGDVHVVDETTAAKA